MHIPIEEDLKKMKRDRMMVWTCGGLLAAAVTLSACGKPMTDEEKKEKLQTSNAMTNYVGELQNDRRRAEQAADKMNKGIGRSEAAAAEAAAQ